MRYMTGKIFPDFDVSCNIIFQDGTRKKPGKYNLHDLKKLLRIYFLSGMGLQDRKKKHLEIYLEISFGEDGN